MSEIVTRAGKGSELTHVELDANFNNLNNDVPSVNANIGAGITVTIPAGYQRIFAKKLINSGALKNSGEVYII